MNTEPGSIMAPTRDAIVVAADGTHRSAGAIRFGVAEAGRQGRRLVLAHSPRGFEYPVPEPGQAPYRPHMSDLLEAEGRAVLGLVVAEARRLSAATEATPLLLHGERVSALVAAGRQAEILVLGRETRRYPERALVGATSTAVAARAACPVVVVPADWTPRPALRGRVVTGIDSLAATAETAATVDRAFALAADRGSDLMLVHAWDVDAVYADIIEERTHDDRWRTDCAQRLRELAAEPSRRHPSVRYDVRVLHGPAGRALLDEAVGADLLLLARQPRALGHLTRLGSTVKAVLRHSDIPVELLAPGRSRRVARTDWFAPGTRAEVAEDDGPLTGSRRDSAVGRRGAGSGTPPRGHGRPR